MIEKRPDSEKKPLTASIFPNIKRTLEVAYLSMAENFLSKIKEVDETIARIERKELQDFIIEEIDKHSKIYYNVCTIILYPP